jgi:hypothetical protein
MFAMTAGYEPFFRDDLNDDRTPLFRFIKDYDYGGFWNELEE